MVEQLRQGNGTVRTIHAQAPTQRDDGTPLAPSEVSHYNWYIKYNNGAVSPPHATQLVNGEFTDSFDVDSQTAGTYQFYYTTVDTQIPQQESVPSNILEIEILVPLLAAPNPPTNVS